MNEEKISEEDWNLIGFVIASEYKRKIIEYLAKDIATPKQISNGTNIRIGHISTYLARLADKDLVICINPTVKMGRLYKLTKKGEKVVNIIGKINRDLD